MSLMLASKNGDSSGNNYHNAGNNNDHNSSQGSNIAAPFLMISIVQQAPFVTESHSSCDDSLLFNVIATEKVDGVIRAKGHEVNLWNFHINGDTNYFIVVHTHKKGFKCKFSPFISIVKIFSVANKYNYFAHNYVYFIIILL